jgi:CRISPR system Cascade subunit CasD
MSEQYLLLWFEGPLQSWGFDSVFGRRDSLRFPTKSGILGLLLSSLGVYGPQRELLARLGECPLVVQSYGRTSARQADTVLENRPRLLMDFQMVGSGYDEKDPWEKLHIPKKSDGKAAVGGGTKMTYRYYLQDASFAAILAMPEDLGVACATSIGSPTHDIFLGRKSCVPSEFVFQGLYTCRDEAVTAAKDVADGKGRRLEFCVEEGEHDGEVVVLRDVPVQFGKWKTYRERAVTIVPAPQRQ